MSEPRWRSGGLFCQRSCWAPRFMGACAALGWEVWWGESDEPFG